MQVLVIGDEVTNYRTFIKVPDEWRRRHEQQSVSRILLALLGPLLAATLLIAGLIFFLKEIKSELMKNIPWRRFAVWGLCGIAVYLIIAVVGSPLQTVRVQLTTEL